jgi:hypothetical protein
MSMATELPNRPTPSADDHQDLVDPTERVQSPTDKPEPRFAAALERAEREARIRARTEAAAPADEIDDVDVDPVEPVEPADDVAARGPFSFNRTAGDTEEDQ